MEEWRIEKPRINPKDNETYIISKDVICFTEQVLRDYGSKEFPSEGLVYWAGKIESGQHIVTTCIAPNIKASRFNIGIDHYSNYQVVEAMSLNGVIHLAQVHSHPGTWIDHSDTDDEYASFKIKGLLSLVVPEFCSQDMFPLWCCGVHRYDDGEFNRLSNNYIKKHFKVVKNTVGNFIDLRNKK